MPENYDAFIRNWYEEVWNQGQGDAIERYMACDAIGHGLPAAEGEEMCGPDGFKPFVAQFKQAFPDLHIEVCQTVSEGDLVVARCIVRGTHTGEGLGIAPTHRPIEITGMSMARLKDGKMVEGWNNFDFEALYAQLQPDGI